MDPVHVHPVSRMTYCQSRWNEFLGSLPWRSTTLHWGCHGWVTFLSCCLGRRTLAVHSFFTEQPRPFKRTFSTKDTSHWLFVQAFVERPSVSGQRLNPQPWPWFSDAVPVKLLRSFCARVRVQTNVAETTGLCQWVTVYILMEFTIILVCYKIK